jgi:predicted site-specific integrase-resolvase
MLVPLREAARRMGVSYATARRRVGAHEWPARRDGSRILVDVGALRPLTDEDLARVARRARAANAGIEGESDGQA